MTFANAFKNYRKLVSLLSASIVFLGTFTLIQYQVIQDRTVGYKITLASEKNSEWSYVWGLTTALRQQAKEKITMIGSNIQEQILKDYNTNHRNLRYDLNNLNQNNLPIINIISKNILNVYLNGVATDANDPWIGTREGVASDFSVDCSSSGRTRSYDVEYTLHFSPSLAKKAIEKLLEVNQNLPLIGWQFRSPANLSWTVEDFTEDNLKALYLQYGLDSLDSFEFLNASYIYPKSDLLGDLLVDSHGNLQNNKQLIIVQGFNLVEQLGKLPGASVTLQRFVDDQKLLTDTFNKEIVILQVELFAVLGMMILLFIAGNAILSKESQIIESIDNK